MAKSHFPAKSDELSRMTKIEPAVVKNIRTQHEVRLAAGGFGSADLGPVNTAHEDFEQVAAGEIVELLVDGNRLAKDTAGALFFGDFGFSSQPHGVRRWDSIHGNHL